jgi:hypothetical protein
MDFIFTQNQLFPSKKHTKRLKSITASESKSSQITKKLHYLESTKISQNLIVFNHLNESFAICQAKKRDMMPEQAKLSFFSNNFSMNYYRIWLIQHDRF